MMLKRVMLYSLFATLGCVVPMVGQAQEAPHSDVEFSYQNSKIEVELSNEGILVFEGDFPLSGLERQFTSEPGFASEVEEGLGIGPDETVVYNVLSSLLFWDGVALAPAAAGTQLRVNHLVPNVPDTLISGTTGVQMGVIDNVAVNIRNLIGVADPTGDLHVDLNWFLEPNVGPADAPPPALGAYGVLLSLSTSANGISSSDPIALVFNFGLDDDQFEAGVEEFASLVPEPSGALFMVASTLLGLHTARRRAHGRSIAR